MSPSLRSAVGSDVGRRRPSNQDSAAITPRLVAVADGMGGHAHGEVASAVAIATMLELDDRVAGRDPEQIDLRSELADTVDEAAARLTVLARQDPDLRGTGTTLVALLAGGSRIGVAHIGDSRAYLLRDGVLNQITRDHTLVQAMVDEGRLTLAEAAVHPRRSWLVRTLQEDTEADPDLFMIDAEVGDRYLVCSDGLTGVVGHERLHEVLSEVTDRAEAVDRLIELANQGGGPDNITCVVADLVDEPEADATPVVVGSAANLAG